MKPKKKASPERRAELLKELHRDREIRNSGYRARALKLFPHICASCAREFSGKRLKELTVHHKDHDHNNNPPDGSNWELLCIYCHDHEHEKGLGGRSAVVEDSTFPPALHSSSERRTGSIANPFDALDALETNTPDDS